LGGEQSFFMRGDHITAWILCQPDRNKSGRLAKVGYLGRIVDAEDKCAICRILAAEN
jgi:hypothetical protein